MSNLQKVIAIIIGLATLVSICFGTEKYFAKSTQLVMVEKRLDQKIVQDQINYIQEQLWKIEDRFRDRIFLKDQNAIDRERRLKKQLKESEEQLKLLKER